MKAIPLYGAKAAGRVALVDDEDYELVMRYRWRVWEEDRGPGRRIRGPYAFAWNGPRASRKRISLHQLLLPGFAEVDHRDHDGLNCQRGNLRPATRAQNRANSRKRLGCTSRYKGVSWSQGRWLARIKVDDRSRHLGYFTDEIEAARAYDAAAIAAWGEYAAVNFPQRVAS